MRETTRLGVYACSESHQGESIVYRQWCLQEKFGKIANLFLLKLPTSEDYDYHFCAVGSLSALLRRGLGRKQRVTYCTYCPAKFYNKIEMVEEKGERKRGRRCVKTCDELREEHKRVCSQVTGDFESALVGCHEVIGHKTVSYQKHVPIAFSFKTCSDIPGLQFRPVDYRGEDAAKVFVKMIRQLARKIQERFPGPIKARRMSKEEKEWEKETKCFACGGSLCPLTRNS